MTAQQPSSIYRGHLLPTTIGIFVAVVAAAFDQTAVTAIMPTIAADLNGTSAYSLTFVVPMASSIIGMVAGGLISDRFGARASFLSGVGSLIVGLVLAMVASSMGIFIISRGIQGLGGGAVIVAIYAIIGQAYPAKLRPSIFAAFAGAWVLPGLVGPALAGFIAQAVSWHGVFGLVAATLVLSTVLMARALGTLPAAAAQNQDRSTMRALLAACAVAALLATMNLSSQVSLLWAVPLYVAGLAGVAVAVRPLTPSRNRLIATRTLVDMFFAAEIYLPLMLAQDYHLGPTLTGIGLTVAGLTWFAGSVAQARAGARIPTRVVMVGGFTAMAVGTAGLTATALLEVHWAFAAASWGLSAAGMGFLYPRLSSEALDNAAPSETGFVGSALQVMGSVGMTSMVALAGLIQTSGAAHFPNYKFTAIFATITLVAVPLLALWSRRSPIGPAA